MKTELLIMGIIGFVGIAGFSMAFIMNVQPDLIYGFLILFSTIAISFAALYEPKEKPKEEHA